MIKSMTTQSISACLLGATAVFFAQDTQAETFSYTGSIQQYVIPTTGQYEILAVGADGGDATFAATEQSGYGGSGATVFGVFDLTAGTVLDILVGGTGGIDGGGGGGSFVVLDASDTPLAVAGGGGGGSYLGTPGGGGLASSVSSLGGADNSSPAGAGGGFTTNGTDGDSAGTGGMGYLNGGAGGIGFDPTHSGGYGGGGASDFDGGGGGGYEGGVGGSASTAQDFATGGGSYLDAGATSPLLTAGVYEGGTLQNGSVSITFVPEPNSLALLGIGSLIAIRRRRRPRAGVVAPVLKVFEQPQSTV